MKYVNFVSYLFVNSTDFTKIALVDFYKEQHILKVNLTENQMN